MACELFLLRGSIGQPNVGNGRFPSNQSRPLDLVRYQSASAASGGLLESCTTRPERFIQEAFAQTRTQRPAQHSIWMLCRRLGKTVAFCPDVIY